MAQLIPGALVQVSGTYEEANAQTSLVQCRLLNKPTVCDSKGVIEVGEAVEILGRVSVDGPAQLLRREGPQWLALSFAGQLIRVDQPRPLNAVDDFVLGPGSNSEVLADAMASQLIMDGYCESRALNLRSEVEAMISATESLGYVRYLDFSRIPAEFEPYYLGVESKEKHALIDLEEASEELIRIFQDEDTRLTRLMDGITPVLRSELGSRITGRTNLMVRQTFSTVEEEKAFQATEPGSGERETFMSLVKRRRVCMMHFLGPRTGTLKLLPRADRPEITIEATPGKLVMFLTERFRLLGQRPEYVMQGFGGDMSASASSSGGERCASPEGHNASRVSRESGRCAGYDLNVYYMDVDNMEAQAEGKAYTAHQLLGPESNRWWRRLEGKKTLPGLSATAKAKDLELRFERLGNVNAGCVPEVVITPRGQLDLSAARALAFALAKEHISVLIWDRRGSGASSVWAPLTEASLPEQEVEDLKVLLDFVQTDRVVLVGLSSGARLSALFAAKYPSRVAGLAVLPTGDAAGAASVLAQAYYGDCREVAEQGGMEAIVATPGSQFHALAQREMQRRALLSVDVKEFVDVMLNSQVFIEGFIGEAFLGLYPEDLRQLQIPALVFHHGFKDDRLHVLEDAEEVARHLKTSLEDAADVEALQMALIAFVKSVAPAGGSGRPA
ncbi:Uncharacterized protein SCF082_LOCUS17533 [Durusdinium trenchii]|uniref:Serine aminopeptidase S33 domain-containing protein n=1 Tax=Durusdinium trenchii TaxID=1381693 RepID=A0ABP0KI38_9DINO